MDIEFVFSRQTMKTYEDIIPYKNVIDKYIFDMLYLFLTG